MSGVTIALNKPSRDILLDLVNNANAGVTLTLTHDDIDFGTPSVTPLGASRNTTGIVSAKPDRGIVGSRQIYWNRLDLGIFFANTPKVIVANAPVDTSDLLDIMNSTFDINLEPSDVIINPVSGTTHEIVANPNSLVWTGEVTFTLLPYAPAQDIDLAVDVFQPYLTGFTSGQPTQISRVAMLGLLNTVNLKSYSFSTVVFDAPLVLSDVPGYNTQIRVVALNGMGYINYKNLFYSRMNIGVQVAGGLTVDVSGRTETTLHALLPYLNTELGIKLRADEVVNAPLDLVNDTSVVVEITGSSEMWLPGSSFVLTLEQGVQLPPGTYLDLGDGSLFGLDDNTLLDLGT